MTSHQRKDVVDLTPSEVISLTQKFLSREWSNVTPDQVLVTRIKSGWVNRVYIAERKSDGDSSSPPIEPNKILIKKYGGNVTSLDADAGVELSREEELLVCHEWSKTGLGPKLIGIFEGGRMEEFVDSRMMKRVDCLTLPDIRRDLAKCLARFHSLDLPLNRQPYDFVEIVTKLLENFRLNVESSFKSSQILQEKGVDTNAIASYDYETDLIWLKDCMSPEHHRIVFIHWDTHLENVLIRNEPKDGESKVVLVDLQQACYNFRGKDLGLHLASLMVDFSKPCEEVLDFPPEDYYISFFSDYLKEVERLGFMEGTFNRESLENPQHLLFESLVGGILSMLYFLLGFINGHEEYTQFAPEYAVGLTALFHCIQKCKDKFNETFPKHLP